jgi:tetratricopeptide (TPR) repeat protein
MKNHSKESIKNMAVLFTDIVGSSHFFKKHGNVSGRSMLKLHQDIVSPLIAEFGGAVVKLLGDSVMAYFLDPRDAFKSAIKIQQRFGNYNKSREEKDQIHIRLCVHYGEGIVEDKDIFGDVVNMAAKFLSYAGADQILISNEVYVHVKDLPLVNFQRVDISSDKRLLNELIIYNVSWSESADFDPIIRTLLYIKPNWTLGEKHFSNVWENMLLNKETLWQKDKIVKEDLLPDKSLCLIVKDPQNSLVIAKKIINFIKTNLGQYGTLLPLQVIIDSGHFLRAGRLHLGDIPVNWKLIEPGEIYASSVALNFIKADSKNFSVAQNANGDPNNRFCKIVVNALEKDEQYLFLYQNALVQGDNRPCFYCGARTHLTRSCPSKSITELTKFIDRIGYLSISEINNLFFNYIYEIGNDSGKRFDSGAWNKDEMSPQWAHYCFYELNSVFQLRFFRSLWNLQDENWKDVKEKVETRDKGGLLWLALDCIRVSNFAQADTILSEVMSKQPSDYKAFCLAAFYNIELNDLAQANIFLKKSYDLARTTPQKIFLLFLRSRIYHLNRDHLKAREMIRRITRLSPYCHEALYLDILYTFKYGNRAVALQHLMRLIKLNRDYYVYALLDPELSDFSRDIHPKLEQLLLETREEANRVIPQADNELTNLKGIIGDESREFAETKSILLRIKNLSTKGSYFGYLDIIHYGDSIAHMSTRIIINRETGLSSTYNTLKQRLTYSMVRIKNLPYPFLARSILMQLRSIHVRFDGTSDNEDLHNPEKFKILMKSYDKVSEELVNIETRLDRLESMGHLLKYAARFVKKNILFQAFNLLIALILFPIITHYLNFVWPDLNISAKNIWTYQKLAIVLGGISAIVLATLMSKKELDR